jgi:redox-sensitive bicupin YhaK (pirin superfamily)
MIQLRKSKDRGHVNHGWLDTYHTFSFANYYDPKHVGFRDLLVINEDRIQGGAGFGTHGHQDMEIITYMLEGDLAHKDSMGSGSVIKRGDVQRMSAGTGVTHSEFNGSEKNPAHFLQIWIAPKKVGLKPEYEERHFSSDEKTNRLKLIASSDGKEGSLRIQQEAAIYASLLDEDKSVELSLSKGRHAWVQIVRGAVELNGILLGDGDGAALSEEKGVALKARSASEFLVFDLS